MTVVYDRRSALGEPCSDVESHQKYVTIKAFCTVVNSRESYASQVLDQWMSDALMETPLCWMAKLKEVDDLFQSLFPLHHATATRKEHALMLDMSSSLLPRIFVWEAPETISDSAAFLCTCAAVHSFISSAAVYECSRVAECLLQQAPDPRWRLAEPRFWCLLYSLV